MRRLIDRIACWRRRCREDTSGATAVEFALVLMPFMWLLIGILEVSLVMYFNNGIEHGVERAGRYIRTGQAHSAGISKDDFRDMVCRYVVWQEACKSGLQVEVQSFPDFASVTLVPPTYDEDGNLQIPDVFNIGGRKQVIVVRAFYKWKFKSILGGNLLSDSGDNSILLGSVTTFRNEPF